MGKLVMGYWDCPVCGSKGIRGDAANCPSCGRARGDVRFYMKGVSEGETREADQRGDLEYLSEEQAKYVSRNPDWYCSFCNSLNSDNAESCGNCGASRADSESNYFDMLKKNQAKEAAEKAAQPGPSSRSASPSRKPLFLFLVVLAAVIGLFVWMNGSKTSGDLTVTALHWDQVIHVERYVSESDWSLPSGADLTETKEEIRMEPETRYRSEEVQRSRQVLDHYETYYTYEDRGNGTFEEVSHERPVYETEYYTETVQVPYIVEVPRLRTRYYYQIWRVDSSLDLKASGDTHDTFWPEVNLPEGQREALQNSREGEYRFTVEHTAKKESPVTYRLAESDWRNISVGDRMYITSRRTGAAPYISDEKGNKIADIQQVR